MATADELSKLHVRVRSDPTEVIEYIDYVLEHVTDDNKGYSLPEWGGYYTQPFADINAWYEAKELLESIKAGTKTYTTMTISSSLSAIA